MTISIPKGNGGFEPVSVGEHIFRVDEIKYDADFGKVDAVHVTADGKKVFEHWRFEKNDGTPNEGAIKSFGFFAHICLDDFSITDVDPDNLVGCYFIGEVEHEEYNGKIYPRIKNRKTAKGFETETKAEETPVASADEFDLDDILG